MPEYRRMPAGFHAITPHLVVSDVARALDFYKRAFNAKEILCLTLPGKSQIMHAELRVGDSSLMLGGECPDGQGPKAPSPNQPSVVTLHLYVDDVDKAFKQAVEAGAKPEMPPEDMFWGDRYSKVKDPFGHSWSLATRVREMSPAMMQEAAEEFFASAAARR